MAKSPEPIEVILEIGKKHTFATALAWPGWSRSGRDEAAALNSLLAYGLRYKSAIGSVIVDFHPPADLKELQVIERLPGNSTTEFGAPNVAPASDVEPLGNAEYERYQAILDACWKTLEATYQSAIHVELRKGPRGGGRELEKIIQHVVEANRSYLNQIGWKKAQNQAGTTQSILNSARDSTLNALAASMAGELPKQGPRGGEYWPLRTFVRRVAWHILDHVWEIEDRSQP